MTGAEDDFIHNEIRDDSVGSRGREVSQYSADDAVAPSAERRKRKPHGTVRSHFPCGPDAFAVEIWDSRNTPEFQFGDNVIIDPQIPAVPGRMVLAAVGHQRRPVFAKYTAALIDGERVAVLDPLNKDWERITLATPADGEVIGVMTEHARPAR